MEWVETTGATVAEAKDRALDQLGVDDTDAEFEIVDEPQKGLFGRVRREARVRARIRPVRAREKVERRERRRPSKKGTGAKKSSGKARTARPPADGGGSKGAKGSADQEGATPSKSSGSRSKAPKSSSGAKTGKNGGKSPQKKARVTEDGDTNMAEMTIEQQADAVEDFLDGLLEAFGLDADIEHDIIDEDTVEVRADGDDLGLLIGPKGQTLAAVQDLARTVVQRRSDGPNRRRIRVDVGGYRQRRKEALERFTQTVVQEVCDSGAQKALEPMSPPDRKIVHDAANAIDGVRTFSEGEEPRRRVVIAPAE